MKLTDVPRRSARFWIVFGLLVVVLAGAGRVWWTYEHHVPGGSTAQSRWHALGWSDYQFTYTEKRGAGPALQVSVTVHPDSVDARPATNPGVYTQLYPAVVERARHRMEYFFDEALPDAVAAADSFTIEFSPRTGVPSRAEFNQSGCCDQGWWFRVTGVQPVA